MKTAEQISPRPIVCGTDFSPAAFESLEIAAALARRCETKLVVVHVSAVAGLQTPDPGLFEAASARERAELEREVARLAKAGTAVEAQFRTGSPFDELVSSAVETDAQLVVIGAVGHGLARRLLVGSVAERTAETSPVPALVVRPGGRLLSWIRGDHPLKVLLGYDFSSAGDAALKWVSDLRRLGSSDINVVHLYRPPEVAAQLGYKGPLPLGENPQEIETPLKRTLEERVAKYLLPEAATLTLQSAWGTLESCLFDISHSQHPDLIVVGTHQRAGLGRLRFGSVSRAVLHHATVSVAVIPPPEAP